LCVIATSLSGIRPYCIGTEFGSVG